MNSYCIPWTFLLVFMLPASLLSAPPLFEAVSISNKDVTLPTYSECSASCSPVSTGVGFVQIQVDSTPWIEFYHSVVVGMQTPEMLDYGLDIDLRAGETTQELHYTIGSIVDKLL